MIKNNIQRRIVSWIFFFLFYPFICMHGHTFGVNSVLSTGKWVKIRVADNGLCRLSFSQLRQMGFSSPSNVKVFGYGGAILSEDFSGSYNSIFLRSPPQNRYRLSTRQRYFPSFPGKLTTAPW